MEKFTIVTLEDWEDLATKILIVLEKSASKTSRTTILGLCGDLGAGKTTFVQALARKLGVSEKVQSPTFSIMKRYKTPNQVFSDLIHMDAYRIESLSELRPLGFTEILQEPATLLCIEWGEKLAEALPVGIHWLSIANLIGDTRVATLTTT